MTVREEVFNKYLEIKQDLINNLNEVFNRKEHYTKKYRGNLLTDINVSIDYGPYNEKIIQIFVRHGDYWIRDIIKYKRDRERTIGMYFESQIVGNLFEDE
jgi:hypothetical protein